MRYVDNSPIENPYTGKPYMHPTDEEVEAAQAQKRQPEATVETRPAHILRSFTSRFNAVEPAATHGDTLSSLRVLKAITKAGGAEEADVIAFEDADYDWLKKSWEKDDRGAKLFGVMGAAFYDPFLEAPKEDPCRCAPADGAPSENAKVVSLAGRP